MSPEILRRRRKSLDRAYGYHNVHPGMMPYHAGVHPYGYGGYGGVGAYGGYGLNHPYGGVGLGYGYGGGYGHGYNNGYFGGLPGYPHMGLY